MNKNKTLKQAFICDAIRTPIGRYGGALSRIRTDDLAALPIQELMKRNPALDPHTIDDVILGCANQAGEDNRNVARMAVLLAGLPETVPGTTINRLCGSSMDAIGYAAKTIKIGEADIMIAGGVESMSRAPFVIGKAEKEFARQSDMHDTTLGWRFVNPKMEKLYGVDGLGITAENVAEKYQISREDQDQYASQSQQRAKRALDNGFFDHEIFPIEVPSKKTETIRIIQDEYPRSTTTLDALAKLKPLFKQNGTVTAGNASGINDGACALLIASEDAVKKYKLNPLAKIITGTVTGIEPRLMGMGPVSAIQKLLQNTGYQLDDMDTIECNEAFASQTLAVLRQLNLPDNSPKVNPNGGAIALGHPLGMSGARLVTTAIYQLQEINGKLGLCSMCIGVGQGIAMLIERV